MTAFAALLAAACAPMETSEPRRVAVPPAVVIQTPADQASFTDVDAIEFRALIVDGNGLDDIASVSWSSSVQGPLVDLALIPDGSGLVRLTTLLASGIHAIEVQVTDSDGLIATDAITLRVGESLVMPRAEILDPADLDVFDLGALIPLLGEVSDPNQAPDTLWARWSAVALSSGTVFDLGDVTPGADGTVAGAFPDPDEDAWILALEVTDDDGNQAIDRVQVTVRDPLDLDNDLDGFSFNAGDCDDADPDSFPGNAEVCDGRDNDCNTKVDDKDDDGDHRVDVICTAYPGPLPADDCDDTRADVFPGAIEVPDGVDQDCDGAPDQGTRLYDDDGDCACEGPGLCSGSVEAACVVASTIPGDCDDADPFVSPYDFDLDGTSACDGDCDDREPLLNVIDADGDHVTTCAGDCDDDPAACGADCFPGHLAADVCDGHNQDCDALTDENPDVTWYPDRDLDGWTDADRALNACADPDGAGLAWLAGPTDEDCDDTNAALNLDDDDGDGHSTCAGDCDDAATGCGAACFPGNPAADVCDGLNQDCDALTDENPDIPWFRDADLDGWTGPGAVSLACVDPDGAALGWLAAATLDDCDDTDATLNLDDADADSFSTCEGDCDDGDPTLDPADRDGDGWSTCDDDCDDDELECGADCFPGNPAPDVCDDRDQDCDAAFDEDPDVPWFHDRDGDGYTDASDRVFDCFDPDGAGAGWLAAATAQDCDDDPAACGAGCFPGNGAADVCDGRNQDCDAQVDEDPDVPWYHDLDGDGFTKVSDRAFACTDPDGVDIHWVAAATTDDCDDSPATCGAGCWPGNPAADVCDGKNQDCDAHVDEDPNIAWYRDTDLDGWTASTGQTLACADPDGAIGQWKAAPSIPTDCDDGDASRNHDDFDVDGWVSCGGDCDDDPSACGADCHPGNSDPDVCDGYNQDCDGSVDENPDIPWYRDQDGDGYTLASIGQYACADPDGGLTQWRPTPTAADCDDSPAACGAGCFPGNAAADVCDGRNQDCDAQVDENPNIAWYHDADGDGFTNNADTALACADPDGVALAWRGTPTTNDCDDNPGACGAGCWPGNPALDVCDGRNQDCDAQIDENPQHTWYRDADGDTWTAATGSLAACTMPAPTGWRATATNPTDCDDADASRNHTDVDRDTWDTCEGDCDDNNAALNKSDVDGDGYDTCELDCNDATASVRPGLADAPDDSYTDNNCDGIDGNVATAVFVSPQGSTASTCGLTPATACQTVALAASRAAALGRTDLYLRAGTYPGVQSWSGMSGIRLYGGYSTTWVRGPRTVSTYAATFTGGTVSNQAVGWKITSAPNLYAENLIVQSPNASGTEASGTHAGKGRSSYAVHVTNSTITLRNITFDPGNGSAGLAAATNGSSAAQTPAPAGWSGGSAYDRATCCDDSTRVGGGAARENPSCTVETRSGAGGSGGKIDSSCGWTGCCSGSGCNATSGLNGGYAYYAVSNGYGMFGSGSSPGWPGGDAWGGGIWDGGAGSAGSRTGAVSGDWWFGGNGTSGWTGYHGGGGGGGGGSGASDADIDDYGAGGGGGGAGGCAAPAAGSGGRAGGSSFGLFAIGSSVDVRTSLFDYANGGNGGNGGSGGAGQPGGAGGSGGSGYQGAARGGHGGPGGRGGHAGGGGGGAGGSVYGMYLLGGTIGQSGNTGSTGGTFGSGGAGGTTGITGAAGQSGERTILKTCPLGGC